MTEKEKAAAGYLYNPNYDKELLEEIGRCNDLCHEFNQIKPSDRGAQTEILKKILKRIMFQRKYHHGYLRIHQEN